MLICRGLHLCQAVGHRQLHADTKATVSFVIFFLLYSLAFQFSIQMSFIGMRKHTFTLRKCQNTIKQLKMENMHTVGGGTMCKQSYVTLCRYIQSIKLFGTNSRFLFSQYNLNSIQKHGSSSVNTVCAVGLGWLYSIL